MVLSILSFDVFEKGIKFRPYIHNSNFGAWVSLVITLYPTLRG